METNKQEIGFDVWRRGEQDGYREARVGIQGVKWRKAREEKEHIYYIYTCTYIEDNFQEGQKAPYSGRDANSRSYHSFDNALPLSQWRNTTFICKLQY